MTNGLESEVRELLHPLRICTPPLPSLPTSDEREDREDCGVREERFFHGRQIQFILRSQFPAPRLAIEGRVHLIPRQPLLSAVSICGKAFHSPDIDTSFTVFVGSEGVCTHEIIPGRGRVSRNKDHFKGLLFEILKQNSAHPIKGANILKFDDPDVERRSLAVYDALIEGDQR